MTTKTMTIQIYSEGDNHAASIRDDETGKVVSASYGKSEWDAVSNAAIYWNNKMEAERRAAARA